MNTSESFNFEDPVTVVPVSLVPNRRHCPSVRDPLEMCDDSLSSSVSWVLYRDFFHPLFHRPFLFPLKGSEGSGVVITIRIPVR